jgi:hypothetical protein
MAKEQERLREELCQAKNSGDYFNRVKLLSELAEAKDANRYLSERVFDLTRENILLRGDHARCLHAAIESAGTSAAHATSTLKLLDDMDRKRKDK